MDLKRVHNELCWSRAMSRQRQQSRAKLLAVTAVAVATHPVFWGHHHATSPHHYCPEHGQFEHQHRHEAGHGHLVLDAHSHPANDALYATTPRLSDHHFCSNSLLSRREETAPPASTTSGEAFCPRLYPVPADARAGQGPATSLALAPKHSPPELS